VETVRESDGLALSSRNIYLSSEESKIAPVFFEQLNKLKTMFIEKKEFLSGLNKKALDDEICKWVSDSRWTLEKIGFKVQYIEFLVGPSLQSISPQDLRRKQKYLLAGALFLGKTRLIDNVHFEA